MLFVISYLLVHPYNQSYNVSHPWNQFSWARRNLLLEHHRQAQLLQSWFQMLARIALRWESLQRDSCELVDSVNQNSHPIERLPVSRKRRNIGWSSDIFCNIKVYRINPVTDIIIWYSGFRKTWISCFLHVLLN